MATATTMSTAMAQKEMGRRTRTTAARMGTVMVPAVATTMTKTERTNSDGDGGNGDDGDCGDDNDNESNNSQGDDELINTIS